jgi:GNAT superfamily N-acetyltransferase
MTLRPAWVHDVETLFDIRCSVRENHQSREELDGLGVTVESVGRMIASGDYVSTIAEVDGRPAGFTMAQISQGYVFACFVRPEFEGRGLGRALMEAAEDDLRRAGVKQAWLSTGSGPHLRAAGFYRHLGWKDDGFLADGQIRFTKEL